MNVFLYAGALNTTEKVNNTADEDSRFFHGKESLVGCIANSQCSGNTDGRNVCYRGRCVECIDDDADCAMQSVTRPYCSPLAKQCVQCTQDSHCPNGVCSFDNTCVECMSNRQCAGRGSYVEFVCSLYASPPKYRYTCGECAVSTDCPYQMTCAENRTCTCSSDAQCGGDAPVCYEGRCQGCPGDGQPGDSFCFNNGLGANCTIVNGTERYQCSECMDSSSCPFGMQCVNRTCTCTRNSQCSGPDNQLANLCSPFTNRCVQCIDSGDCIDPSKSYCVNGTCEECTGSDSSCPKRKQVTGNVQCSDYGTCLPFCTNDNDCALTDRPYCHQESNTCTVCRDDVDCSGDEICYSRDNGTEPGRCVECTSDSMCLNGFVCNQRTNTCSTCSNNTDCPIESPICSDSRGTCIQCDDNSGNCPTMAPICHGGVCRACVTDADCPNLMHCSPEHQCEMCLEDSHCAEIFGKSIKPFCNIDSYTCGNCQDDGDCPAQFPLCSKIGNANMCTQCNDTHPCAFGQICSEQGICAECLLKGSSDRRCPLNRPFCSTNGQCVSCLSSTDCKRSTESCFDGFCKECESTDSCSQIVETLKTTCTKDLTCLPTYHAQG